MKRALAAALFAGLAATAVQPPVQAVPVCGPVVDFNCWNGTYYCRIWIAPRTCTHTA